MAKNRRKTVKDLAKEANVDIDEILLLAWENGLDSITDPNHTISGKKLHTIRRAIGIPHRRELTSIRYWQDLFSLDFETFILMLNELSINIRPGADRLPKGAVSKLKAKARTLSIPTTILNPDTSVLNTSLVVVNSEPEPEFVWRVIGHEREIRYLFAREVLEIHEKLVDDFSQKNDPIEPPGVKDINMLESAVFRPKTCSGDKLKYPTVEMSAAALLHSLVQNHPFHNGNKRTALVATLVFLDENNIMLTCNEDEIFKLVLQIAQHRITNPHPKNLADRETLAITEWIWDHSRPIERGERPVPFRRLRQMLAKYGCEFEHGSSGSKIKISRKVQSNGSWMKTKKRVLTTIVYYGGEGKEVERNSIGKIRSDLHLDDNHGYDSGAFYDDSPVSVDDFIVIYQKTLKRLSKL